MILGIIITTLLFVVIYKNYRIKYCALYDNVKKLVVYGNQYLTEMNIQLRHMISDITGVIGIKIIKVIIEAERNKSELAEFQDHRIEKRGNTVLTLAVLKYKQKLF